MQYYNEINKGYDRLHGAEQGEKARLIKGSCELRGLLLDVGAGTGRATQLFGERAECVALDPAKEMVGKFPGMKVVGRAEQLPFKDACFDSVVSLTALHHAVLEKAVGEIERVSKESAVIAISFFKRAKNFEKARALFKGFREIDSEKDLVFVRH